MGSRQNTEPDSNTKMVKYLSIPSLAITLLLGNQVKVSHAGFGWPAAPNPLGGFSELLPDGTGWVGTDGRVKAPIKSYRISCKSDTYKPGHNYAGIVVYDGGSYPNVLPGYVIMADSSKSNRDKYKKAMQQKNERTEGLVHGYGVWKRFGESPTTMIKKYGMKFAGFAYYKEKTAFESGALNARSHSRGGWHHDVRMMVDDEKVVIAGLVEAWKKKGIAKTYFRDTLRPFICSGIKNQKDFNPHVKWTYKRTYRC